MVLEVQPSPESAEPSWILTRRNESTYSALFWPMYGRAGFQLLRTRVLNQC
ncbi:hypothetical protein SAMN04487768_0244 [Burkholderia sp. b13]|nr:hypothetical protein SAMN04487768_0244 [Burkholderia sp. b13]